MIPIVAFLPVLVAALAASGQATAPPPPPPPPPVMTTGWLPGREADARVATIGFRLATAGLSRCPLPAPATGVVLEHLSQFALADRAGLAATQHLDRGPEAVAVAPGSPADTAGIRPGDVVLAVDDVPLPPDGDVARPFDAARARVRSDVLADLVAGATGRRHAITLLRHGGEVIVPLAPRSACPSRLHLARSAQVNGYADGRHVLLTTGLLARLDGDDQLAFVIAHEMAHNILGHAAAKRAGAPVRGQERDADRLGGMLMLDAGYDPVAGAQALERLGGLDLGIRLFASHDSTRDRIEAMRRLVAERRAR